MSIRLTPANSYPGRVMRLYRPKGLVVRSHHHLNVHRSPAGSFADKELLDRHKTSSFLHMFLQT